MFGLSNTNSGPCSLRAIAVLTHFQPIGLTVVGIWTGLTGLSFVSFESLTFRSLFVFEGTLPTRILHVDLWDVSAWFVAVDLGLRES